MKKFDLGIRAKIMLPMGEMGEIRENIFVGIEKDTITQIQKFQSKHQSQCRRFIDGAQHILMPGLINAHTHLPMTLLRGIQDNSGLQEWLFKYILPIEQELVDQKFVKVGTELAAFECIRFGTTAIADMYFYPDVSAMVWEKFGLRGLFSIPYIDGDTPEDITRGRDKRDSRLQRLIEKYKDHAHIRFAISPHAPYTCSDDLLKHNADFAKKHQVPLQTHLSESAFEVQESHKKYQKSPTERLHGLGILSSRTLCAHCVHMSASDITLIKKTGTHVVFNPDSNLKLASGIAPIKQFLEAKVNVALGTDGAASSNTLNLFQAMNSGAKALKLQSGDGTGISAEEMVWIVTRGGAKAIGRDHEIGRIAEGMKADLILIDTEDPHFHPMFDPFSQLVFATHGLEVDTTVVGGKILMSKKKFVGSLYRDYQKLQVSLRKHRSTILRKVKQIQKQVATTKEQR